MRGEKPVNNPFVARQRTPEQDSVDQAQAGANPVPTRAPLQARSASPAAFNTSGMEGALGQMADKLHPTRRR